MNLDEVNIPFILLVVVLVAAGGMAWTRRRLDRDLSLRLRRARVALAASIYANQPLEK